MRRTAQPCHADGGPHPQPNRFAGNQYFRSWGVMREAIPCGLTVERRDRRRLSLALHLPRVRSSEVLGDSSLDFHAKSIQKLADNLSRHAEEHVLVVLGELVRVISVQIQVQ